MVRRGAAAGLRPWEMGKMIQVPLREIQFMLSGPAPPDPFREEIQKLINLLTIEAKLAEPKLTGAPFRGAHAALVEKLEQMCSRTYSQLKDLGQERLAADPAFAAAPEPMPEISPSDLPSPDATLSAPSRLPELARCSAPGERSSEGWDRSADAANKELGKRGEEFVVEVERRRLRLEGRADLAARVVWTARDEGDGAGYDVASFNADGSPRLIEVKTTNGGADTPFLLTANEVRVSAARANSYWLYRVYDYGKKTRAIYVLQGALDSGVLNLEPRIYYASR